MSHGLRLALLGLVPLLVLLPGVTICAVLAGTVLAGALGTLLAVPVAAVLGVLLRFGLERYRASPLFGPPPSPEAGT